MDNLNGRKNLGFRRSTPITSTFLQQCQFFQLLLIRNWQQWQEQKAQLGKCQACGKLKAEGGCGGERQSETFNCWLAVEANELNV
ncbi:TPA: hypothetical protein ACVE12_005498 [Klebsiella pneumoniae]